MEECINEIEAWMLMNRPKLNGEKTEMLTTGTHKQCKKLLTIPINFRGSVLEPSEKARNLGIIFDKNLTLKSHVNALCQSAKYYLHKINLARRYLTRKAAEKAIHALVISRIDYNDSPLYGLPSCNLQKLQKIQNAAARTLTGKCRKCHITPLLKQINWLPIVCRTIEIT